MMTSPRSLKEGLAALLLMGTIAPEVHADPVTITTGLLRYPLLNEASIEIHFRHGSASLSWSDDNQEWHPDFEAGCCTPGMTLNLSGDESFSRDHTFPGFSGEIRFGPEVYSVTSANFSVVALRSINVPVLTEGEFELFTGIPFTLHGTLTGLTATHRRLVIDLIGSGHATATIVGSSPTFSYLGEAFYEFEVNSPTPVPEPGTLLLFATGLAVAAATRRCAQQDSKRLRLD